MQDKALWKLEEDPDLIDLGEGLYLVRLYHKNDYLHLLQGGPWVIMGHYLVIQKGKPDFLAPSLADSYSIPFKKSSNKPIILGFKPNPLIFS